MGKAIFLNFPTHGCINSLLGTVSELVNRGQKIIYYCTEEFRNKIEQTGAEFRPYKGVVNTFKIENDDLSKAIELSVEMAVDKLEHNLEAIRKEKNIRHLSDLNLEEFISLSHLVSDETERRRARHVITENSRTLTAIEALNRDDLEQFGQLMNQSHDSLRDDYEVTGKELDTLVDEARKVEGTLGSRMTGAGFGGCTVSIVKEDAVEAFIRDVGIGYNKRTGLKADFYVAEIGDGSKEIT